MGIYQNSLRSYCNTRKSEAGVETYCARAGKAAARINHGIRNKPINVYDTENRESCCVPLINRGLIVDIPDATAARRTIW